MSEMYMGEIADTPVKSLRERVSTLNNLLLKYKRPSPKIVLDPKEEQDTDIPSPVVSVSPETSITQEVVPPTNTAQFTSNEIAEV